MTGSNRRPPPC